MTYLFSQSKQVEALQSEISQNNDLYAGRKKLLENIDYYYAGLELDSVDQKAARWARTPFYLYYPKVISSFNSSIFKKPPLYELPVEDIDELITNVDLLGNNINEYVAQIPHEVLKQGFSATITDYSKKLNRPYLSLIKPEQFVSFQTSNDKGYPELSQFIYTVQEERQKIDDEFTLELIKVHYVWSLHPSVKNPTKNRVRVRKYEREKAETDKTNYDKTKDKSEWNDSLKQDNYITQNGKELESLPIIIHGKESNNYVIEKSVLQDVSDLNIDLINRVVDQIEVLHMTALPTPWISGIESDDPDAPTTIGSSKLWILSNPDATVGMLEFDGKSAQAHRDYIEDLRETMAVTGAQILKQQGVSRETATSVLIRSGQETAVITSIVQNISSQVVEVLKLYFTWAKKNIDGIVYKLNSDFLSVDMEPNAQIALVRSWLDGAISHKTVFEKMKEGEIVNANKTFEQELEDIKENPPPFPGKEKDAEIASDAAEQNAKLSPNTGSGSGSGQESSLKGSNLETGNAVKNTEVKN